MKEDHASFEAFSAVMIQVEFFWVVTPCIVVVLCILAIRNA
jgi:hypothetical protein